MKKILFLLFILFLNSCGHKGPLYLPEKQYPIDDSAPQTERKIESDDSPSGTVDE